MLEWLEERVAYLMDALGLSDEEAREQAQEDYFDGDEE